MWTLLEIRPWPSPCIGVHCSRLLCSRPDVCSSAEIGKSRFYHPRTQFNWRHMRTIMFDFEYHKYFYFKQLIIGYLAWNWNKTMVLKCQIFEETFLQFASCLLSHRWVSALVTTKNVFKSRLFATNLPASPGDIRKQKYCNDQTEMSQFRVTCYCEMISIWSRLAAPLHLLFLFSQSLPSFETRVTLPRMCGVSWGMICGPDVGIAQGPSLKLKYFLLVLIYGSVTPQVLHRNVLLFFLFTAHWDQQNNGICF